MLLRSQRILAGLEIYSLVLWVGGLFFLVAFADPAIRSSLADLPAASWKIHRSLYSRFGSIQALFAGVVLASNFVKLIVFRRMFELQRYAVLLAAIALTVTAFCVFHIRPELDRLHAAIPEGAIDGLELSRFTRLHLQYLSLTKVNLVVGLFLIYAYRTFEERKLQSLIKVLKNP